MSSDPWSYDALLERYPAYRDTLSLDGLRAAEYRRLDEGRHVYLDYTGAGLYAESQVRTHAAVLASGTFGNPHSANPTSSASTELVERARGAVLDWFGASSDVYTAVFTSNATAALKLVGESYPFGGGRLLLATDNHNSVNGIREFARRAGAEVAYAPLTTPDLRLDRHVLSGLLATRARSEPSLFVFPAQSNFSGVRHPLRLVTEARAAGWDVLLDAAAYVPTSCLDLGAIQPDFVAVSFYKMFGFPTGVGCLIARREALSRLHRPWFGGGTVDFATVAGAVCVRAPGEAGFEDGTLNFLSIPAVEDGLRHLARVGMARIHTRVEVLTSWALDQLAGLRHTNGTFLVRIYGPIDNADRGGTIAFNLYDPSGHLLDYRRVEELAAARRISLRTGCFCNPGVGETAEALTAGDVQAALLEMEHPSLGRFMEVLRRRGGRSAGAMRASLGLVTSFEDVRQFVEFIGGFRDQTRLAVGSVTFDIGSCRIIRDGS